jgi:hypothetical protein
MVVMLCIFVSIEGCGAETVGVEAQTPIVQTYDIVIDQTETGFEASLPDGRVYTDPGIFHLELPRILAEVELEGFKPRYFFGKGISGELDKLFDRGADRVTNGEVGSVSHALTLRIGSYALSDSYGVSRVNGCVGRDVLNYTVYLDNRYSGVRYQAYHFAAWAQYGHPCLGFYESVLGLANSCTCDPDEPSIFYDGLRTSLSASGASPLTAAILASIIATMAHTALLVL